MPGTGHLELIRETVAASTAQPSSVELRDVFFVAPFSVSNEQTLTLNVELQRASGDINVYSDSRASPHVTAAARLVPDEPAPTHDVAAIRLRCTGRVEVSPDGFPDQQFMDFGPRWANFVRAEFGEAEALVSVEMPHEYVPELADLWLHPSLLDMLTGNAQALIPGYSKAETFYVPFSYGRVLVRGPLPRRALSHVCLRESSSNTAVFDVTVMDAYGREVVAIEAFRMRRTRADSVLTAAPATVIDRPAAHFDDPIAAAIREGIRPTEGVDALDRLLLDDLGPQVITSAVDLHDWIAKIDAEATIAGEPATESLRFERPDIGTEFEPPSTPIERELASMWQDLLGVQTVGRNDDFFELGGQSLSAVRLFTRLRHRYEIDLPLTTLFEGSTIAACAAVIARRLGIVDDGHDGSGPEPGADGAAAAAERTSGAPSRVGEGLMVVPAASRSLVSISAGGTGRPLFMVHGAGGNVLFLWTLARALSRDRPVFGFQAMGVNSQDEPDRSLEEMAARYVDELTSQHDGPYLLGGYSGGGIVTLEMSRLLRERGHEVMQALLFDSVPPRRPLPGNIRRLANIIANARRDGLGAVTPRYSTVKVRRYVARAVPFLRTRGAHDDAATDHALGYDEMDGYVDLYDHFSEVADGYAPTTYDVDVTLFKADQIAPILPFDYYWTPHVRGRLELRFVHGDHHSMFYPAFLPHLADTVRSRLFEIESTHQASSSTSSDTHIDQVASPRMTELIQDA